jgi:SAM-dependent methyltransferase
MGTIASRARDWLSHPLTRGLDIDDPRTTALRRRLIREKPFLRRIYREWYRGLAARVPGGAGEVLELGSGAGFLHRHIPGLITSEVFPCPGVDRVVDAHDLPFDDDALRAILMTDVLHHLARPREFFRSAARCVRPGGVIAMVEPWVSPWSRFVYSRLHHEPFRPQAAEWEFPPAGPLSGANGALPWILFVRDRKDFGSAFPEWRVETIRPMMPLRYLLSGGVSLRSLAPGWAYPVCQGLEWLARPFMRWLAMFAQVTLRRA